MELGLARKQVGIPIVNNSFWDNFLTYVKTTKKDMYVVESKFFIKMENFMGIFSKFQEYVDEWKNYQAKIEEINCMVEDISIFQENCPRALIKIPKMASHDNKCYVQACDRCGERGKAFKSKASRLCMVCAKVDYYIDNIFKELGLPPLVVGNQLFSHD